MRYDTIDVFKNKIHLTDDVVLRTLRRKLWNAVTGSQVCEGWIAHVSSCFAQKVPL